MFDMASIRKLKELNLSFVPDLSLPQFSEALSKFVALQTLRISQITNWGQRINATTLLAFIADGAINLRNLTLDLISFSDEQFKALLLAINKSKSLRTLTLSSVHLDTDYKVELLTGFIGSNKNALSKLTLAENQLTSLDTFLSMMYQNRSLKELNLLNQTYFRSESRLTEGEIKNSPLSKENRTVEKLSMSLGMLKTIKPLIRVFATFTRLKEFNLSNIELTNKMYFQVIDNYLISNPFLAKLTLSNVKLGYDQFIVLAGTIRNSRRLRSLDLSSNQLRN